VSSGQYDVPMSDVAPGAAQELVRLLPDRLSGTAREVLDLDERIAPADDAAGSASPPLPFDDARFDLILSLEAFSLAGASQQAWLAEVARLLADHGVFVAALPASAPKGSPDPGRDWVALRKREAAAGPSLLEEEAPGGGLAALLTELDARHRRELDAIRESFHRELMRKSLRIAELEPDAPTTPASWAIAERVASTYESTLSWRITAPVRAAKRALARR
jgi:SAM-dependent methyltransferase